MNREVKTFFYYFSNNEMTQQKCRQSVNFYSNEKYEFYYVATKWIQTHLIIYWRAEIFSLGGRAWHVLWVPKQHHANLPIFFQWVLRKFSCNRILLPAMMTKKSHNKTYMTLLPDDAEYLVESWNPNHLQSLIFIAVEWLPGQKRERDSV